jgi:hypothetical protein
MLQLSRVFLGNFGHRTAFFPGTILDFRNKDGKTSKSVALFAENGKGKTSALSAILHVFQPAKGDFVQTLQKDGKHVLSDYFIPNKPCFIILELTRKSGGLIASEDPALVIGICANKKTDNTYEEEFFLALAHEVPFDSLPMIKASQEEGTLSWTKQDSDAWIKGLRDRHATNQIDFKYTRTQREWLAILESHGLKPVFFRNMVQMAKKEGGVDVFLKGETSEEVLKSVFDMVFAPDAHEDAISAIHTFLQEHKTLPDEMRRRDVMTDLLKLETSFTEAFDAYAATRSALTSSSAHLKGLRIALQEKADAALADIGSVGARLGEIETAHGEAAARKLDAEMRLEAARLLGVRRKLSEVRQDIEVAEKEYHHYRLINAVIRGPAGVQRRLAAASETASVLERTFRNLTSKAESRRAPVDQAGSHLAAVLRREMASADKAIADSDARVETATAKLQEARKQADTANDTRVKAESAFSRFREAEMAISAVLSRAMKDGLIDKPGTDALDLAAETFRTAVSDLETARANLLVEQAGSDNAIRAEEAELRLLSKTKEDVRKRLDGISRKLGRIAEIQADLENEYASVVEVSPETDLSDRRLLSTLTDKVSKAGPLLRDRTAQLDELRRKRSALDNAGAFEDPDVALVLEKCRELGIDAEPFARWLSDNHADADVARSIVERNLAVALGIRVFSVSDIEKIQSAFERKAWGLSKPVTVTLIDAAIELHLGEASSERIRKLVLSARTDYGYNAASLASHKARYDTQISELAAEASSLEMTISRGSAALKLLAECDTIFEGNNRDCLKDAAEAAAAEIAEIDADISHRHKTVLTLRESKATIADRISQIDADIAEGRSKVAAVDSYRREIYLEEGKRGSLSEAAHVAEVETTGRLHAEARRAFEAAESELKRETDHREAQRSERRRLDHVLQATLYRLEDESAVEAGDALLEVAEQNYARLEAQYKSDMSDDERMREARRQFEEASKKVEEIAHELDSSIVRTAGLEFGRAEVEETLLFYKGKSEFDETSHLHIADQAVQTHRNTIGMLKAEEARLSQAETMQIPSGGSLARIEEVIASIGTSRDRIEFEELAAEDRNCNVKILEDLAAERDELRQRKVSRETDLASLRPSIDRIADRGDFPSIVARAVSLEGVADLLAVIASAIEEYNGCQKRESETRKKAERLSLQIWNFVQNDRGKSIPQSFVARYEQVHGRADSHGYITHGMRGEIEKYVASITIGIDRTARAKEERVVGLTYMVDLAKQKIQQAVKVRIPKGRSTFSGREIMKLPKGLEAAALDAVSSREVAMIFLDRLIANPQSATFNRASQLLVSLLRLIAEIKGIGTFDVRVLKTEDQTSAVTYEKIHKLTGSVGQTITTALLINLLATKIASDEMDGDDAAQSFIILDNPSGQSNAKNLVDTQLEAAAEFGIQMITTTGINDYFLTSYEWVVEFVSTPGPNRRNDVEATYPNVEIMTNLWELRDPMRDEAKAMEEAA